MSNTDIRLAIEDDRSAIEGCVKAAYSVYIVRIGKPPAPLLADYAALIAQGFVYSMAERNEVIGVLVMKPAETFLLVENVAVRPDFQGRGLGHALMGFAERAALTTGLDEVRLYTSVLMTENLRFYAKLGFQELYRSAEDGYQRVFLSKKL